jgi:RNA polymerase primary sigma factor
VASEIASFAQRFLSEVGIREPLPIEDELRLAELVSEGKRALKALSDPDLPLDERQRFEEVARQGQDALTTLVANNLPLVVGMTRRYRWSGISASDLFQEGVLGLLRAAERFDWTRGTPFGAYASWWVRHAMSRAVREATTSVRLSQDSRSMLRRLAKARNDDPSASFRRLAERAGVDAAEAEHLAPLLGSPLSLEGPVVPDSTTPLGDLVADRDAEEAMEEVLVGAEVERLLRIAERELTPRERHVLEARYGLGGRDPRTLREVGEELGLTAQRVAQIEERALEKLRAALRVKETSDS